jgi:hypothetical protein
VFESLQGLVVQEGTRANRFDYFVCVTHFSAVFLPIFTDTSPRVTRSAFVWRLTTQGQQLGVETYASATQPQAADGGNSPGSSTIIRILKTKEIKFTYSYYTLVVLVGSTNM